MKRIQIIEDDPDIVELVRYNLAQEGFQVSSSGDGRPLEKQSELLER